MFPSAHLLVWMLGVRSAKSRLPLSTTRHAGEGAPLACVSTRAVKDVSHRSRRGASKVRGVVKEPCRSLEHFEVPRIVTSLHSSHTSSVHSMCCSCKSCQKDRSFAKAESRQIFWPHAHFQEPRGETLRHVLSQFNRTTQHVIKWLCVWPCSCACVVLFEYTGRDKDGIKNTDKEKSDRWIQTHNKERKTKTSVRRFLCDRGSCRTNQSPQKVLEKHETGRGTTYTPQSAVEGDELCHRGRVCDISPPPNSRTTRLSMRTQFIGKCLASTTLGNSLASNKYEHGL